jgi:signal transduction histidine kinase
MERGVALYVQHKNGNEIPTHIMLTPLQTQDGPRVLVVIRDISELNEAHTMLQKAYSTLEEQVERRTANLIQANDTLQNEIEARKQAETDLEQVLHQIKTLSARLLDIQENERRSLALELHDQIGQSLTAIKLNIQAAQRMPAASAIKPHLEQNLMMVEQTLKQVRNLSLELRPSMLDDLGLTAALRWYVDRQAQQAGYKAEFHADMIQTRLDSAIETACFRIAQEAVTNVNRHAYAGMLRVGLQQKDSVLELIVQDDGDGFDTVQAQQQAVHGHSLGLLGMRERVELLNGRLDIESSPGNGTLVRAQFPLTHPEEATA